MDLNPDAEVYLEVDKEEVQEKLVNASSDDDTIVFREREFEVTENDVNLKEGYYLLSMHSNDECMNYVSVELDIDAEWVKMMLEEINSFLNRFKTVIEALK